MATLKTSNSSIHYELLGDPKQPLVLLIAGLGGAGRTWGDQVERFARHYCVVLPDQHGTGQSAHDADGQTIARHAADMAHLLRELDLGPAHVVGTSTGGAIAQVMALDHPEIVRTLTLASSWARCDAYLERELRLRRELMATVDVATVYSLYGLLLFSPRYMREQPHAVESWIARASAGPVERDIAVARLDMLLAHDTFLRLGEIGKPTLIMVGEHDMCTPPQLSEELAAGIPSAKLLTMPGGHMLHAERSGEFLANVRGFIDAHSSASAA